MGEIKLRSCYKCKGKGILLNERKEPQFLHIVGGRCFRCLGTGKILKGIVTQVPCPKCLGTGDYYGGSCNMCSSFRNVGLVDSHRIVNIEMLKNFYGDSWPEIESRFKENIQALKEKENGKAGAVEV